MAQVVIMPKQGQSVESCIVTEFKKKVGDKVAVGDILFSYETDKASFDEESKVEGTVLACFFNDNDEIPCLTNVMVIGEPGESFAEFAPDAGAAARETAPSEVSSQAGISRPAGAGLRDSEVVEPERPQGVWGRPSPQFEGGVERSETVAGGIVPQAAPAGISPRAKHLAAEKGVDPNQIAGSGPGGRVIERDVIAAAASPRSGLAKAMMAQGGLQAPASGTGLAGMVKGGDLKTWKPSHTDIAGEGSEFTVEKMSNMRKLIAKSMYNSLQNSAQLTHMLGADARKIQALRKKAKKAFEEGKIDANVTINDFVCYAVIRALQKFPKVNSHCLGDAMRLFNTVNLGCAVDTERGLMVPCVKHAEDLNITGLSKALKQVADDCRKGSINPDLLSAEAASFTVSNLGGFGVEWFTPVINLPQSAILGVGTIVARPKDLGGGVYAFVPYLGLSLTYDHRALDGGEATRFLKQVATEIENLDIQF
ncbi:MAG: 2-oxo acid dehydrogenase subunit E2 [Bacteroidales bacterium]|nr:2-oxo acid dehydrogenase subunit E2 [Bacteroidales bacterium]